jgi:group I intron endonuclease
MKDKNTSDLTLLSGIYQIINTTNNKIYVGSSINVKQRFNDHKKLLRHNKHPNNHLQSSWVKYGETNFNFKIIEFVINDDLLIREQFYIDLFSSYDSKIGYNLSKTAGSTLGYKFSEESKIKMSNSKINTDSQNKLKEKAESTNFIYLNLGESNKININIDINNPFYNKSHSEESKEKMRLAKLGDKNPNYGKGPMLGKTLTEENKSKIANGNSGKNNKKSKPIIQFDLELNQIKEWDSAGIAAKMLNLSVGNIWMCCNGKARTSYGFIWKYKN